jgi:hypothetical protein
VGQHPSREMAYPRFGVSSGHVRIGDESTYQAICFQGLREGLSVILPERTHGFVRLAVGGLSRHAATFIEAATKYNRCLVFQHRDRTHR